MLSEHLEKIDRTSSRNLFLIAGVLVIVCQLVAMALVASSQVEKAELRDSELSAQNIAMARCFEASARFDRHSCLLEAGADKRPEVTVSQVTDERPDFRHQGSLGSVQTFLAASFDAN